MLTDSQRAKLHRALLGYLAGSPELSEVAEIFAEKAGLGTLTDAEREKDVASRTMEKKWTAVVRLHSDKRKLQAKLTALEAEIEAAGGIEAALGGGSGERDGDGAAARGGASSSSSSSSYLPVSPADKELEGHRAPVTCVAFHPKFQVLASSGEAGLVKLWNYDSGELERTLKGHTNVVKHIAFDPAGKLIASCSSDLTVKLWDFESYACVKTLRCVVVTLHCGFFLSPSPCYARPFPSLPLLRQQGARALCILRRILALGRPAHLMLARQDDSGVGDRDGVLREDVNGARGVGARRRRLAVRRAHRELQPGPERAALELGERRVHADPRRPRARRRVRRLLQRECRRDDRRVCRGRGQGSGRAPAPRDGRRRVCRWSRRGLRRLCVAGQDGARLVRCYGRVRLDAAWA